VAGPSKGRFETIFQEGFRAQGKFCRILFMPGTGMVGFATSKSIGSRPRRNLLRRRFQSAARDLCIPAEIDVVIQIKALARDASYQQVAADLAAAIETVRKRWAEESASS
jgi:ribonuclease P protein component